MLKRLTVLLAVLFCIQISTAFSITYTNVNAVNVVSQNVIANDVTANEATIGGTLLTPDTQPTSDEKAALAGMSTPSADNPYATEADVLKVIDYSAAQALTGLEDGDIVQIAYRSSLGDGGGGLFIWDDTAVDVATVDPEFGVYLPPGSDTTGVSGCLVRQFAPYGPSINWFGASTSANDVENDAAIQAALDTAKYLGIGTVSSPAGTFDYTNLTIDGVVLTGQGGHTGRTVLNCTGSGSNAVTINSRSSGIIGVRLAADATRRSGGALTDIELLISAGDVASPASLSRLTIQDVFITNGAGIGFYCLGNPELSTMDTVTVQGCAGHPMVFDDGTVAGYTNKTTRPFEIAFDRFRAFSCGGNILIGRAGQTSVPRQLVFNQLEVLDCAYDTVNRVDAYQVIVTATNVTFNNPDIENQRYDEANDVLGNAKANPNLTQPVNGMYAGSNGIRVLQAYLSGLLKSFDCAAINDIDIEHPAIFSGDYGVAQAIGIAINLGATGLRFKGSAQSGATRLIRYAGLGGDIMEDGRRYIGAGTTAKHWDVSGLATATTVASGTLLVDGEIVEVMGQDDLADSIVNIRVTSGHNGFAGAKLRLWNQNAVLDSGTHDGSDNASVLADSTASWTVDEFVGKQLYNTTDGSNGVITANTANTITATLSGGTDDDWDSGDSYEISGGYDLTIVNGTGDILTASGSDTVITQGGFMDLAYNPTSDKWVQAGY